MNRCIYCSTKIAKARAEVYDHCTDQSCVDRWLAQRRSRMSMALIPKVGYQPVYTQDMRGVSGRASGK